MSWSGFKKNDREYEVEERRFRTLEAASLRLQKEAKGYLDSLRAMTASQMRIAETIDAFYGDSGARDGVSRSYKQAVEDLDAETVKALDGPYRCVPDSLAHYAKDETVVKGVEEEWNFRAGNERIYTQSGCDTVGFQREYGLMEHLYRTTVLEPINRFCAYFPDINECIKKRQGKMLDYDAMRAKVKKLTEKPDKDPGKLPRTEKETEMVSNTHSLYTSYTTSPRRYGPNEPDMELDLGVPSPPKALQRPEIQKLRRGDKHLDRVSSMDLSPSSRVLSRVASLASPRMSADTENARMQQSPSMATSTIAATSSDSDGITLMSALQDVDCLPDSSSRTFSMPVSSSPCPSINTTASSRGRTVKSPRTSTTPLMADSPSTVGRRRVATPFFQPCELGTIMAPFKQEFLQKQADDYSQAKQAYEQLNEQLSTELPQLIDLRVPYLDPSFEALVKIQLRFCAEAYSRMAQVQQYVYLLQLSLRCTAYAFCFPRYLDASTRDQYASGDLDARVEDVLGQIRELSIAGTV
ncbi:BAR adaptor protein Hob3 [Vermiconidia calcicola]|uniref:BAR adaptor protein Hob3 n=1 Tax=Vermiconidia calcicola TaxID=1690605 RepID=A0ACC3NJ06_9PEZI|nr:BAR adaptor protein Hob3 [Vermiconidia calcicola]